MKSVWMFGTLAVGFLGVAAPNSQAAFINTFDRGWYDQSGFHNAGNTYYTAGQTGGSTYRNFFAFDLSGVSQTITSAKLRLYNDTSTANGLNFVVSDVSTALGTLLSDNAGETGIYDDLGTGTAFGVRVISSADNGQIIEITLNAAALAALNANLGGQIAFGGRLDGAGAEDYAFGPTAGEGPGDGFTQLEIGFAPLEEVPAPPAVILGVIGVASLLGVGRFRRKPTPAVA